MDLDKGIIKALASDTKVNILKSISSRRKMPSEVSKELGLAASTTVEHMKQLEKLGLLKRVETGHKWVYYELSDKGRDIIKPTISMKIVLVLSVSFAMLAIGSIGLFSQTLSYNNINAKSLEAFQADSPMLYTQPLISSEVFFASLVVLGLAVGLYGFWRIKRRFLIN
ncbi:MAG: winged helix-turn-helix transcriptional regulator [Candidatus Aenigmarchaeota archaeon]|nr:winged helix-turn-helix transcriptional regulator [Candidatus Aenigmarchaeota archaeon]